MFDCYYRLATSASDIVANMFSSSLDELQYQEYYNFNASLLGREEWVHNPALREINDQFPIAHAGILRMEPNTGYDWHTDTDRQLAINMVLPMAHHDRHPSHTLFSRDQGEGMNYHFAPLNYVPGSLYVFNTQVPHTVINFASKRYLFSVEFETLPQTTYENVRNFCLAQGL